MKENHDENSELELHIKKVLSEEEGETSYLPLALLVFPLLLLVAGSFIHFYTGNERSHGIIQLDSLSLIKLKIWGICMAVFAIPLTAASLTPYQRRKGRTGSVIIVLGLMAGAGFFLSVNSGIDLANRLKDAWEPRISNAEVLEAYYMPGSSRGTGDFFFLLLPEGMKERVSVRTSRELFMELGAEKEITVYIHRGYFSARWLSMVR
jgi:hypothetical protein